MPLEVRELVIRANLVGKGGSSSNGLSPEEVKKLKAQLLRECKAMIAEMMREKTER